MAESLAPARILGIESSCDETAAAVVENGRLIQSNLVASQVALHAQFGGVFPEVASRQHIRTIYTIIEQALQQAHLAFSDGDAIARTAGPSGRCRSYRRFIRHRMTSLPRVPTQCEHEKYRIVNCGGAYRL